MVTRDSEQSKDVLVTRDSEQKSKILVSSDPETEDILVIEDGSSSKSKDLNSSEPEIKPILHNASTTEGVSKSNASTSQSLVLETLTPDPIVDSSLGSSTGQHVYEIDPLERDSGTAVVTATDNLKQENKCENCKLGACDKCDKKKHKQSTHTLSKF